MSTTGFWKSSPHRTYRKHDNLSFRKYDRSLVKLIKMDGNKDESERCIKIAQKYYSDGDKERAIKFLNKAERLYPTEKAKGEGRCAFNLRFLLGAKCGQT